MVRYETRDEVVLLEEIRHIFIGLGYECHGVMYIKYPSDFSFRVWYVTKCGDLPLKWDVSIWFVNGSLAISYSSSTGSEFVSFDIGDPDCIEDLVMGVLFVMQSGVSYGR